MPVREKRYIRQPDIVGLFGGRKRLGHRKREAAKVAGEPGVPRIVDGGVGSHDGSRFSSRLDLPERAVFEEGWDHEEGAILLNEGSAEFVLLNIFLRSWVLWIFVREVALRRLSDCLTVLFWKHTMPPVSPPLDKQ